MPRNPEMPFEPPPDRPPTPEETAEFARLFKEKPELSDALDQIGAADLRKQLDEATKRGENAAMNLWTTREERKELAKTSEDARSEVDVLNVAIDELEQGDPDAALQFYDFDNELIRLQLAQSKDDKTNARKYEQAIASLKRQKENLMKYARLKRAESKK